MLFTKEELAKEVENTEFFEYSKKFPNKTTAKEGDKTPFQLIFANKVRYFDLASHSVKDILYKTRKSIVGKCYNNILDSAYPNEREIEQCVQENQKEFNDLLIKRETHFSNVMHKFNTDLASCPTNDNDCRIRAEQTFVWNAAKLPYFFMENGI